MTHAEEIMRAASALVLKEGIVEFSRQDIRKKIGLSHEEWMSGYTAIFQGMRIDQPGGAPSIAPEYRNVFRRQRHGVYTLTARVWLLCRGGKSELKNPRFIGAKMNRTIDSIGMELEMTNRRGKGYNGETCAEAIRHSIRDGEVVAYSTLFARVREKGGWKDDAINQHLMSCVVNLPPARRHWKHREPFLFLRPDGQYECHSRGKHPVVIE